MTKREIGCGHPYWEPRFINNANIKNWKRILLDSNYQSEAEIKLLKRYAERIGLFLHGYWSVDFCQTQDGRWYFIDAAPGDISWHPYLYLHKEKR
ncbi:MAG: hypothetical protein ARM1_0523 [Candidatus Micrarchaeota archaeon]|nr:MAG: hypothetical protein ARM1_0523 [Candidatus Micrarchaeota archaeon]